MFAQESVMDIQKESEAFEKHASKFFTTNEAFENDGENYVYDEVKFMWDCWLAAKAQAVPEGFVLVSAEQMSQWGHMASYAEQYGCPECFEARGYAHSLACEINEFFAIEAQEPAND